MFYLDIYFPHFPLKNNFKCVQTKPFDDFSVKIVKIANFCALARMIFHSFVPQDFLSCPSIYRPPTLMLVPSVNIKHV